MGESPGKNCDPGISYHDHESFYLLQLPDSIKGLFHLRCGGKVLGQYDETTVVDP